MMGISRRQWLSGVGGVALLSTGYVWSRFRQALDAAEQRIKGCK
jgi:hypothetical protein